MPFPALTRFSYRAKQLWDATAWVGDADLRRLSAVSVLEGSLGAVLDAQLREQMLHVELHRVVGEAEPLGDLRVRESPGNEPPDLALARGQVARRAGGSPLDPAAGGLREHQLARFDPAERPERPLRWPRPWCPPARPPLQPRAGRTPGAV